MMTGKRTNNLAHLIVLVCVTFAAGTIVRSAFAQAGSAGGSVGQQDKSVSGSEDQESAQKKSPRPTPKHSPVSGSEDQESAQKKSPRPTPKHSPVKSTNIASRCSNFAGTYSYALRAVTVFKSDGTASNSKGTNATWTCANGTVTVRWNSGFIDTLIPSGGSSFSATNNHGWVWSANRM